MTKKEVAFALLEQMRPEIFALGQQLFDCPELGFREEKTAAIVTEYLKSGQIPYRKGVAVTGVQATLGNAGYHIGLMADMDALLATGPNGRVVVHSCGHSIQLAVMLAVMRVLRESGVLNDLGGKVSFFATPAEEYIDLDYRHQLIEKGVIRYPSGKQNMIAEGLLDGVDCVLNCHVMGDRQKQFDINSTLAGFSAKKVRFLGQAAHSGVAAHAGKNALHAATLFLQACAFLKDQFPPEAGIRLHPILTEGGASMNVVPDLAVVETYLRANTTEELFMLQERFDAAANHCAAALGMSCEIENGVGYLPLRQSGELCNLVHQNMLTLCGEEEIAKDTVSGASGDIGDVARILPAVQFGFSGTGGRVHSSEFTIENPEHVYIDTAKVLLGTVVDLLENPQLQVKNLQYETDKANYLRHWLGEK